jgi:very-short-patch-repair endonuclease
MASAAEVLDQAQLGRVATLFCDEVAPARRQLRDAAEELDPVPTLVTLDWQYAPSLARELDEIRDALADAAGSLWPAWYVTAEERFASTRVAQVGVEALATRIQDQECYPGASRGWLREAFARCAKGKRPVVRRLASTEQVRQLSLALDPSRLIFALSVELAEVVPARVRGLARAAEWLALEAHAKTVLLVPKAWRGHPELDHVTYGAMLLDPDEPYPIERISEQPRADVGENSPLGDKPASALSNHHSELLHVSVGPIVGKPHPGSEVEQLIHARLCADDELSTLFEFNQRVHAFGNKHYIVDLVWRAGGLIVELDGPEHNRPQAYFQDRDRDYRLFMSGYATLRVPNAEVWIDVDSVITKIRNVVQRLGPPKKGIANDAF